ncbi:MAG: hypothetical protein FJ271_18160 [Planctomycetes bacterium]|nr:hypothetical protein [Planctomycetota bacterium]
MSKKDESLARTIDDDYRRVLRSAGPDLRRVLYFIGCTAARPVEVISLRWNAIDWRNCRANLAAQKAAGHCQRVLALGPDAIRLLRWLRKQRGPSSPYVFRDALGARWSRHALYQRLRRITRMLGFPAVLLLRDRFITNCLKPFPSHFVRHLPSRAVEPGEGTPGRATP